MEQLGHNPMEQLGYCKKGRVLIVGSPNDHPLMLGVIADLKAEGRDVIVMSAEEVTHSKLPVEPKMVLPHLTPPPTPIIPRMEWATPPETRRDRRKQKRKNKIPKQSWKRKNT